MRKLLFAAIMTAVFVTGMVIGTIPLANAVQGGDKPTQSLANQISAVNKILQRADARLGEVLNGVSPPVAPEIKTELQNAIDHATSIIARAQPYVVP